MKKGFTLIELLVVISIIALLSSIILAAVSSTRAKAVTAAGQTFDGQMYQAYGANAVAIWNFDDGTGSLTAADSSGYNNNLTIASWSPSLMQTGIVFTGRKSALSIPVGVADINPGKTPATFITGTPGFNPSNGSVSLWINLFQGGNQQGVFCSQNYGEFCIFSSYSTTAQFIQVIWGDSATLSTSISPASVLGVWTQVTISWNIPSGGSIGTMNIYVNGKQVANSSSYTAPTLASLGSYFCIGGDCLGDDMFGTLDQMRVYSQSLQTGEIQKLYAEELPHYKHLLADK